MKNQEPKSSLGTKPVMQKKEVYKGIEFIRISTLPADHQLHLIAWITEDKIIKILREDEILMRDCVQYRHYLEWFTHYTKFFQLEKDHSVTKILPARRLPSPYPVLNLLKTKVEQYLELFVKNRYPIN